MSTDGHSPEAAINAAPPGGWESGAVADGETAERNADAAGSPSLSDAGSPANTQKGADATLDGTVEGDAAGQGSDPDLSTDDDLPGKDS